MLAGVTPERLVAFRVRTILSVLGIVLAVAVTLEIVWIARHIITWILIAVFLALALNPAVEFFSGTGSPGAAPRPGSPTS